MSSIEKHRIGHSPLTNNVYLYRFGRDAGIALDKRDALNEVLTAAARYLLDQAHPSGAVRLEMDGRLIQLQVDVIDPAPALTTQGME